MFLRLSKRLAAAALVIFIILGVYAMARVNTLLTDFKKFFEKRFSAQLKLDVRIGSISGGIVRGLTFNNVTVIRTSAESDGRQVKDKLFKARRVFLGYKIWDLDKITKSWESGLPRELKINLSGGEIFFNDAFSCVDRLNGFVVIGKDSVSLINFRGKAFNVPINFDGSVHDLKDQPNVNFRLGINGKKLAGTINVTERFESPKIGGFLQAGTFGKVSFEGQAEIAKQGLSVKNFRFYTGAWEQKSADAVDIEGAQTSGSLELSYSLPQEGRVEATLKAEHVKINDSDFLSNVELKTQLLADKHGEQILTGEFATSGTLLNYRPFAESECSFKVTKKELEVLYFKFGNNTRLYGSIMFSSPAVFDFLLNIEDAELSDLLSFLSEEQQQAFAGRIIAQVRVSGPVTALKTKGHLESGPGGIGGLFYQSANINFEGKGPYIKFVDSRLRQEKLVMVLDGEMDLRKLTSAHPLEGIRITTQEGMVLWEGWDPTRGTTDASATFKQSQRLEFGTYINEDRVREQEGQKGGVELDYKLRQKERLKMRYEQDELFMGLERKVKF